MIVDNLDCVDAKGFAASTVGKKAVREATDAECGGCCVGNPRFVVAREDDDEDEDDDPRCGCE